MKKLLLLALVLALAVPAPALVGAQAEAEDRFEQINVKTYGDCEVRTRQDALALETSSSLTCGKEYRKASIWVSTTHPGDFSYETGYLIFIGTSSTTDDTYVTECRCYGTPKDKEPNERCSFDKATMLNRRTCKYEIPIKFSSEERGEVVAGQSESPGSKLPAVVDAQDFLHKMLRSTHVKVVGKDNEVYTISLQGFNAAWADFQQRAGLPNP